MKMLLIIAACLISTLSWAKPPYLAEMKKALPDKAAEASCKSCHDGAFKDKKFTEFGKAFVAAGKDFSKMKK